MKLRVDGPLDKQDYTLHPTRRLTFLCFGNADLERMMSTCPIPQPILRPSVMRVIIFLLFQSGMIYASKKSSFDKSAMTSGMYEEKWVIEEEFHGASSLGDHHHNLAPKEKQMKSYPGPEGLGRNWDESWWEEEDTEDCLVTESVDPSTNNARKVSRPPVGSMSKRPWRRRNNASGDVLTDEPAQSATSQVEEQEHPMRTDEWELDIQLSRLYSRREAGLFPEYSSADKVAHTKNRRTSRRKQVMQFAKNGYVKILRDDSFILNNVDSSFVAPAVEKIQSEAKVGKWRIGHGGVVIDIPVSINSGDGTSGKRMTTLHYHADIHLNKFGERPRMFRGVITRDRHSAVFPPNFLRPVIGTFSAEGIGRDTCDTSYKDRGFGLTRQQVLTESQNLDRR